MRNTFKKIFSKMEKEQPEQEVNTPETDAATENTPTTDTPEENPAGMSEETQQLRNQLEEMKNKYLYLAADFENYKRHSARERMDLMQTANRDVMAALLPVLDDFDRAEKTAGIPEGIKLIHHKLLQTLRQKGLKQLELQAGAAFDADTQEAVTEIPVPQEELKGKIVDIIEPGYLLGEKIIRFAKVVVGK